jgi:threonine/homoserine/homoserine lactone efflux protein
VKSRRLSDAEDKDGARSLLKASLVNLLSPHPYLFWFTVGGPRLAAGWRQGALYALCFLGAFYACLVGSKIIVAAAASQSRDMGFFSGKAYLYVMRALGAALLVFAFMLAFEGMRFFM